jgi:hypothetical protein
MCIIRYASVVHLLNASSSKEAILLTMLPVFVSLSGEAPFNGEKKESRAGGEVVISSHVGRRGSRCMGQCRMSVERMQIPEPEFFNLQGPSHRFRRTRFLITVDSHCSHGASNTPAVSSKCHFIRVLLEHCSIYSKDAGKYLL